MYIPREEIDREHERLKPVYNDIVRQLKLIPGVVAVGAGVRRVKGSLVPELCIKVTVEKKKAPGEIPANEQIPAEILGFKTDVEEMKEKKPHADDNKYRPLVGGSCLVNAAAPGYVGTLGCFATVTSGAHAGQVVILSNWHVLVADAIIPFNGATCKQRR